MPAAGDKIISTPARVPTPFWKIICACLFVFFLTGLTVTFLGMMLAVLLYIGTAIMLIILPCAVYVFALMTRPFVGEANRTVAKASLLGLLIVGIVLVIIITLPSTFYSFIPFLALVWPCLSIIIARMMDAGYLFPRDALRDDFFRTRPPAALPQAEPPQTRWYHRFPRADTAAVLSLPFHLFAGPFIGLFAIPFEQGIVFSSDISYGISLYAFHFLLFVPALSFVVSWLFFRAATKWRHLEVIVFSAAIALGIIAAGGVTCLIELLRYSMGSARFYYPLNPLAYQVFIAPVTTFFAVYFLARLLNKTRKAGGPAP